MSKGPLRNATINDVADRAGVSYQTVSRVINNQANVAASTRERVLHAIEELNYRPSLVAKGLVTRKSNLIGIVAYGTGQFGPAQIVQNVEQASRDRGYEVMLTTLKAFEPGVIRTAIERLKQFGVEGLVLLTPLDAHKAVEAAGSDFPFIMIDATRDVNGPSVSIDQFEGARLATEHLVGLGHRLILHLAGPSEWSDAELRHQGYLDVLARHGLPVLPRQAGDWSARSGYAAVLAALEAGETFTAIFSANDQMALGAIAALQSRGLRVPEDISVVGFDDSPESAFFSPPLTTVEQNLEALGRKAVDELTRAIASGQGQPRQYLFQPNLIVRASTAAPGQEHTGRVFPSL